MNAKQVKEVSSVFRTLFFRSISTASLHKRLMLPGTNGYKISLLRHFGASLGKNVRIHHPLTLINAKKDLSNLSVGDNVYLGHNLSLDLKGKIDIGSDVTVSMNVTILTHMDVGEIPLAKQYPSKTGKVTIKENTFIGTGAIILCGVTIGEGAVVGAGAVVTKDVRPGSVVVGVPAAEVKNMEDLIVKPKVA